MVDFKSNLKSCPKVDKIAVPRMYTAELNKMVKDGFLCDESTPGYIPKLKKINIHPLIFFDKNLKIQKSQ